jgi:hypothetical protein
MTQEFIDEVQVAPPLYLARRSTRLKKRTQRETLLEVLRMAGRCESWMTLGELAAKTRYPPASISAQLRHLRKPEYGGWEVKKRRRESERDGLVWEYRLAG